MLAGTVASVAGRSNTSAGRAGSSQRENAVCNQWYGTTLAPLR